MFEEADIYDLVELLGLASGLDGPLPAKKQFLLDGLSTLIGAEAWSWSRHVRGGRRGNIERASGGSRALLARTTHARSSKRTLNFSELSDGAASTILFLRRASRPPFTERENLLARIVCEEIPWLHEAPRALPAPRAAQRLSPRQREALDHLMAGLSYQEVSQRMGISLHTVNDYVKGLYRMFGQHSRAGLIAQLTDTNRAA